MLLGKRPRHLMKRTTSMSEITFDVITTDPGTSESDTQKQLGVGVIHGGVSDGFNGLDHRLLSMVSPRTHRKNGSVETAPFLRACFLCKRRLIPGRDIYMYRGDSAFCSCECREQQMKHDERQEKCSMASKKEALSATSASSQAKAETITAV